MDRVLRKFYENVVNWAHGEPAAGAALGLRFLDKIAAQIAGIGDVQQPVALLIAKMWHIDHRGGVIGDELEHLTGFHAL